MTTEEEKFAGTSLLVLSALKTIEVPERDFWCFFWALIAAGMLNRGKENIEIMRFPQKGC